MDNDKFDSVNIGKSPLEFVLVGPHEGKDKILVRSDGAGLDLVGLAIDKGKESERNESTSILLPFFENLRDICVVESRAMNDLEPTFDTRHSSYRFVWVGSYSKFRKEEIKKVLDRSISDLRNALQRRSKSDVEIAIAPIILECTLENQRRLKRHKLFSFSMIIYFLLLLLVLAIWLLQRVLL